MRKTIDILDIAGAAVFAILASSVAVIVLSGLGIL